MLKKKHIDAGLTVIFFAICSLGIMTVTIPALGDGVKWILSHG